jgi:hypothetical protein
MEFWQIGKRISRSEAEKIIEASEISPDRLRWWPA